MRGRVGQATATAVSAVLVLGAGLAVVVSRAPDEGRSTRLESASQVVVRPAVGAERVGRSGDLLADGDTVVTAAAGGAVLVTGGRRALVAGATTVVVASARDYDLRAGGLVVDRRRGPALAVRAGQLSVRPQGGVTRLQRDFSVRVGVYSQDGGGARLTTAAGADLMVPRYGEAEAVGSTLPTRPRPLRLRDALDRVADPDLAVLDAALVGLARKVDADTAAPVLLRRQGPGLGTGTAEVDAHPSEVALPLAIAQAAGAPVSRAVGLRRDQAPWGVVAGTLGVPAGDVGTALTALLLAGREGGIGAGSVVALAGAGPGLSFLPPADQSAPGVAGAAPAPSAPAPTAPAARAGGAVSPGGRPGSGATAGQAGPRPSPVAPAGGPPAAGAPGGSPPARPSPGPGGSPAPGGGVVGQIVGTVASLLPLPAPSPLSSRTAGQAPPAPAAPAPAASPSPSPGVAPGLLAPVVGVVGAVGGLLGPGPAPLP